MTEVALLRKHHCDILLVADGYYFLIPFRAPWLYDSRNTGISRLGNRIGKWEKGIRCQYSA